jgi:serine/threonine-protein kinase
MVEDDQDLPPGSRLLDRYAVIDCVAAGGMATIHRALDERFDRIVCVKLLRLDFAGQSSTSGRANAAAIFEHFLREASALSKLQHPNTLRIYDFGYLETGQRPFQVSEFLDGGNLRQLVRGNGPLRPEEMLAVLECVTGAIAEAHEHRILHRDIKPSNILFARVGGVLMPKLADFGIARTLQTHRGRGGVISGGESSDGAGSVGLFSPRWAAPEQLAGAPEGPETDVYALALVAGYMLTGKNPFDGADRADVFDEQKRADPLVRERLGAIGIPAHVTPVFARAMAANPDARTPTAGGFLDELRDAFAGLRPVLPRASAGTERRARAPETTPSGGTSAALRPDRGVRVADVHEKLDFDIGADGGAGVGVRFRVSILPAQGRRFQIQIKGLSCFVARQGAAGAARPTPALSATDDGTVDLVSTTKQTLARVSFAFGTAGPDGRQTFHFGGGDVVVSLPLGAFAVALDLGGEREKVVLCKRT